MKVRDVFRLGQRHRSCSDRRLFHTVRSSDANDLVEQERRGSNARVVVVDTCSDDRQFSVVGRVRGRHESVLVGCTKFHDLSPRVRHGLSGLAITAEHRTRFLS